MKPVKLPSPKYLDQCVSYDPDTGLFYWRQRPRLHFVRQSDWRRWNNMFSGKPAFCSPTDDGYLCGVIDKRIMLSHRVAWKITLRREPPDIIDHENKNKADNKWKNLRKASSSQNASHRGKFNSSSGYRGVYPSWSRWSARLSVNKKRMYFGTFATKEAAFVARVNAEKALLGKFAP